MRRIFAATLLASIAAGVNAAPRCVGVEVDGAGLTSGPIVCTGEIVRPLGSIALRVDGTFTPTRSDAQTVEFAVIIVDDFGDFVDNAFVSWSASNPKVAFAIVVTETDRFGQILVVPIKVRRNDGSVWRGESQTLVDGVAEVTKSSIAPRAFQRREDWERPRR